MNIGDRVQVNRGLSQRWGRPLAFIRSIGPKKVRVQLLMDGSEHYVAPEDLINHGPQAPLVVVCCGGKKLDHPAPAGELYIGSYHLAVRRAAEALTTPDNILILSAKHGLLDLDQVIEPYNLMMGQPGSVTVDAVRTQARGIGRLIEGRVVVLAPKEYVKVGQQVWPYAETPLIGTAGIGQQLQVLSEMKKAS